MAALADAGRGGPGPGMPAMLPLSPQFGRRVRPPSSVSRGLACLALLLASAGMTARGSAAEWVSAEYGFTVTYPEGGSWKPVKIGLLYEPVFALAEGDAVIPARVRRGFSVEVYARESKQYDWRDSGIGIMHSALAYQHRARKIFGRLSTFNGLPAYECTAELVRPDDVGQVRITGILTDRYWYYVSIVKFPGDPATDPELRAMFRSFQLTGHPRPPPPPLMPAWLPAVAVIALAIVAAAVGLVVVQRKRRNRVPVRRLRYGYSKKAQELAGNPVDAESPGRAEVSTGWNLAQQESDLHSALRSPNFFLIRRILGHLLHMGSPPPDPKDFGKHQVKGPLKIDRRFLKQQPKTAAQRAGPAAFRAQAAVHVPGRGLMLSGTVVSGTVVPGMSFVVPGFPLRVTVRSVDAAGGPDGPVLSLLLQEADGELAELWQSLDVAGLELAVEPAATGG